MYPIFVALFSVCSVHVFSLPIDVAKNDGPPPPAAFDDHFLSAKLQILREQGSLHRVATDLLQAKGNALETLQKTGIIDWALGVACSEELFAAPRKMLKNNERASTVLLQLFASSRRKICGVEVENKVEISKQPRNKENDSHSSLVMLLSSGILTAEKRKKSVFCQTLKKKTKKGGPPCTDDSPSSIGSKAFLARPRRERARAYFAFVDNWLLGNEASEGKKSAKPRRAKLRSQTMTEVGQCALIDWFGEVLSLLANHEEATSIVEEHTGDRRMTDEEGHHHLHFQLTTSNKSASKEDSALPVPVQGIAPPPRVVVRRRRRRPKRAINLRHLLIASNTAGILSLLLATGILVNIQLSHPTGSVLRLYNGLSFGLTIFAAISLMLIPSAIQNARRRAAELAAIAAQQLLNAEVHPPGAGEQQRRREVFPALVTLVDDDGGEGQNNRATFQGVCAVCLTELRETPPETRIIRVNTCGHIFHEHCLQPWFIARHSCPVCRADMERIIQPDAAAEPLDAPLAHQWQHSAGLQTSSSSTQHQHQETAAGGDDAQRRDHHQHVIEMQPLGGGDGESTNQYGSSAQTQSSSSRGPEPPRHQHLLHQGGPSSSSSPRG